MLRSCSTAATTINPLKPFQTMWKTAMYELYDVAEIKVFCAANAKNQHEELHGCRACTCEKHKNCFMD